MCALAIAERSDMVKIAPRGKQQTQQTKRRKEDKAMVQIEFNGLMYHSQRIAGADDAMLQINFKGLMKTVSDTSLT